MYHIRMQNMRCWSKQIMALAIFTVGMFLISLAIPTTSYAASSRVAMPHAFSCHGAPGINFPAPWSSRNIGAYENASCTSKADTISATADLLHYDNRAGVWTSISEAGLSCNNCYNISVALTARGVGINGDLYKVEGWYSATSAGHGQGESGFTNCWTWFDIGHDSFKRDLRTIRMSLLDRTMGGIGGDKIQQSLFFIALFS